MSEASNSTLVLDELTIGDPISQHHGVKCCPAIREATDERYIVKILSIPASQVQLDALLLTGAYPTPAHALEYFRGRAEDVLQEVEILNRLHAMEGFLPYIHAEIRQSEDNVGYQVYLVSPYKRSLERQMQLEPLTHLGAVNLGLDLCAALAICRRAGYLYIDLKPSNIYITPNQGFRISDLGFISLNSLKYASFPEQYRSPYTAPEITDAMSSLNARIDIYALGLILYQVYNNGQLPAENTDTLLPPAYADYEMAEIILKACDPNPTKRWTDPLQMGQAIVAYMQRNNVNDVPIVPPPAVIPEETEEQPAEAEATEVVEGPDDTDAVLDELLADIEAVDTSDEEESAPDTGAEAADETEAAEPEEAAVEAEPEVPAEADAEDPTAAEEPEDASAPLIDLSFMDAAAEDETAPTEESAAEITDELVSEEVQEMLARADVLISHELPEPAVAPEPIDVPFPAPIVLPDEPDEAEQRADEIPSICIDDILPDRNKPEKSAADNAEGSANSDEESQTEDTADGVDGSEWVIEDGEYPVAEYYGSEPDLHSKRSGGIRKVITVLACIAIVAALIMGGLMFYRYYYVQNIESLTINGSVDSMTVLVESAITNEQLTAICTDTYGNTHLELVVDGKANFTNLTPNTQYRVQLSISGFHQLKGQTTGTFTTAAQTEILNFNAVAGPEDGSVILSFAVNGPETDNWTVAYSTGNDPETVLSFSGHTVTITDLDIGSEYLFRLVPATDQHLTGSWLLRYTAQQIVFAQDLSISSFAEGTLTAVWTASGGVVDQSWNVRCYNDNGYDQTVTTTANEAQFSGLDHSSSYTVEVTAVGMTQSTSVTISADPITITSLTATPDKNDTLKLEWTFTGEAPAEGWVLNYSIDGGAPITVSCPESNAQIIKYPGSKYEIDVKPVADVTCFNQHLSYEVPKAEMFDNYGVTAENMSFYMCLTPAKENWDRFDVPRSDYVKTFKVGVKASFLVELWENYQNSKDEVTVTYVIRSKDGAPVSLNSEQSTWNKLWDKKFCELDIPQMPEIAGEYTVDIYFNGQQINKDVLAFTIT